MHTGILETPAVLKERRLTKRVQKSWTDCTNGGPLPSWDDIQELDLGADWHSCFAVDLSLSDKFPYFIFLGENLSRLALTYLSDRAHRELTPVDLAVAKMDEAALSREPVFHGNMLRLPGQRNILFRSVVMPLSENGEDVTHIFGAASGKGA